jgi:uncharacterized protein YlxP (DUF503 family)
MTIGLLRLVLFIADSNSLKAKRMVLHSLKARLRNNFNIAVQQIADEDKWQKSTLAVVGLSKDRNIINSTLSSIVNFVEDFHGVELLDYEIELL